MVSWEARAGHSSGTEVEVAFPLLGWDLAGGGPSWEGRSHPGPKGATSPGSYSEGRACSLQSSLPLQAPERRQVAMAYVARPPACSPGSRSPVPRPPEAAAWKGREGVPWGAGLRVSYHLNTRVKPAPSSSLPPLPHPACTMTTLLHAPFDQRLTHAAGS